MDQTSVYVVSLTTSHDRQRRFSERFQKSGADPSTFNWFYAVKNQDNPEKGCFDSHNQILKIAKSRKDRYALVFEDDAVFIKDYDWKMVCDTIQQFIDKNIKNWKYFTLGYLPIRTRKTQDPKIVEILCSHDTHAYLINVQEAELLTYDGVMFDAQIFCQGIKAFDFHKYNYKAGTNVYGSFPMLFTQEFQDSSIHNYHLTQGNVIDFYRGENNMLDLSKYVNSIQILWLTAVGLVLVIILVVLMTIWYFAPEKIGSYTFIIWGSLLFLVLVTFSFIFGTNYHPMMYFE